jgi:hypothetical protein
MSACEKCWSDAHGADDKAAEYARLIRERTGERACTAEQQAGPDAGICPACGRRTAHQHTGECMSLDCASECIFREQSAKGGGEA